MADLLTTAQKGIKSEGRRNRSSSPVWNRMLLASGLALLVSFGACAPRAMYSSEGIIETLFKQETEKRPFIRIGESKTGHGCIITLNDIMQAYDDISPKAVLQIYHTSDEGESLSQTAFSANETKRIFFLDGTAIEISVTNIRSNPDRSECGAGFHFRQLETDKIAQAGQ